MALYEPKSVSLELGGRNLRIETGRLAKQAHGSVFIQYGDTTALVTAVCESTEKVGIDFFPLTLEFQERFYSAGKIPGGYFKKEGRPTDWATLNARLVDRPIRPLFPEGFKNPTQVVVTLTSYDGENEPETISGIGASCALLLSDAPFTTPVATVRVGRIGGQFVVNPKFSAQAESDVWVLVSGTQDAVMMVEGGATGASEDVVLDAIFFGHEQIKKLVALQVELAKVAGKAKRSFVPAPVDVSFVENLKSKVWSDLETAFALRVKQERYSMLKDIEKKAWDFVQNANPGFADWPVEKRTELEKKFKNTFGDLKHEYARHYTLHVGRRIDGRAFDQVRPIQVEVGVLPRVHGSALFTRGETQALVTVTLGTSDDEQLIDSVIGRYNKKVMLHYNFPPFSVGETGRFGGNSRREIGHSALAERAVVAIVPEFEKFPYTIRIVSEILESNGSSSMASVCGASMALMDAGVPLKAPVAGIAMGLMKDGDKVVVLSDILGDEDHLGDMDFKVCGTEAGVTAIQMDIKIGGVSREIMHKALMQARQGRLHILGEMAKGISDARKDISKYAPKITSVMISQERIKDLIGPGGKNIKNIVATTGVKIDIEDSGKVNVGSNDPKAVEKALQMIRDLTEEAEIGKVYMGTVVRIEDYGCFVTIMPGTDGLCHISELDHQRVRAVRDVVQEGDQIPVKVLEVDRSGKIRLSRKAALPAQSANPGVRQ
jgi:polyribonucleotide nucleotidyltransferase